jgi:hypothetical protein
MIVVAAVSVVLWSHAEIGRRRARFERLADHHFERFSADVREANYSRRKVNESGIERLRRRWLWHLDLYRKYHRASRSPWLPVWPDSPQPE